MSPGTMRAVTVDEFGPPQNLRISPRPVPEPGPDEISIDVAYAGVGFVDTLFRAGAFPMPTPLVPGIEVTGRVRAVGSGAASPSAASPGGFVPGQMVGALLNDFGRGPRTGGYAEVAMAHQTIDHLAPFGRHLVLGNASGDDQPFSGDQAWLGSRVVAGLSVGGVAHVRPAAVTRALIAVITLVARGVLSEPRPAVEPLEQAAAVHQAIADRRAPVKTVLSVAP